MPNCHVQEKVGIARSCLAKVHASNLNRVSVLFYHSLSLKIVWRSRLLSCGLEPSGPERVHKSRSSACFGAVVFVSLDVRVSLDSVAGTRWPY